MNVLVYTRPRIKEFFHHLSKNIEVFDNITYMSDHKGEEPLWIMEYYYKAKKDMVEFDITPVTNINSERVVSRCRYLRTLAREVALKKVTAMTIAIERIIEQYQPDLVFGMVMDSFILDIFDLVLRSRNSQYVGFLNNMINGYSRLTSRGELIQLSEVTKDATINVLADLSKKNYVPNMQNDFMWKTTPFSMFFTKYVKEKFKITYYFLKKMVDNDFDNFYYNTVASKHCMSCRNISQLFYRKYQENDWLERIKVARTAGKTIVYFPLQFYPECSIDYWGTNIKFSDFYSVVNKILNNKYQNILILAKEHPSAMGLRKTEFYAQFKSNENVILTPFDVSSNSVIEQSDVVLTWTGSVGVEAIMRDKCLISLGEAYYDPGYGICKLNKFEELSELENKICETLSNGENEKGRLKEDIVEYILRGLIPGYVFPLDYGTKKNPYCESKIKELANGINEYVIKLKKSGSYKVKSGCI